MHPKAVHVDPLAPRRELLGILAVEVEMPDGRHEQDVLPWADDRDRRVDQRDARDVAHRTQRYVRHRTNLTIAHSIPGATQRKYYFWT
jgi:hypothetical protein